MAQHRFGDLDHVARQPAGDRGRRTRIDGDFLGDGDARCQIDRIDETKHQFGIVPLFFRRVRGLLNVQIREHAHQRRAGVDAIAARQVIEPFEFREQCGHRAASSLAARA